MTLSDSGALLLMVLGVICQQTRGTTYVKSVGCLYRNKGAIHLHCESQHHIYIVNATLGTTSRQCQLNINCCKLPTNYTLYTAELAHIQQLKKTCNGQQKCVGTVAWKWTNVDQTEYTDYESVTYICSKNPPRKAQGCVYAPSASFKLHCQQHEHVEIVDVLFGLSAQWCHSCCPTYTVCTLPASIREMQDLKTSCNGLQECSVTLGTKQCQYWTNYWGMTDYETIHYFCVNNPPAITTEAPTPTLTTKEVLTTTAMVTTSDKTVSITAHHRGSSGSSDKEADVAKNQANAPLIVGLTTAACVVVIAAVLVVLVYRKRHREPATRPVQANQSSQPDMNIYEVRDSNQSTSLEANLYDTITRDNKTRPSDDTHVYYNNIGQTEVSPGDEHVYYNTTEEKVAPPDDEHVYYNNVEQTVVLPGGGHVYYNEQAKGVKNSLQTSPDVPTDELYSKPMKHSKPANDSQDIYAEVKRNKDANTDQQVDSGETPGDSDMQMVENELYS